MGSSPDSEVVVGEAGVEPGAGGGAASAAAPLQGLAERQGQRGGGAA